MKKPFESLPVRKGTGTQNVRPYSGYNFTLISIASGTFLENSRGTIAMARTMVIDSASSQFFINLADNDF